MSSNRIVTRRFALAVAASATTLPFMARARATSLGYIFSGDYKLSTSREGT